MIGPEVSTRLGFLHSFRRSPALGSIAVTGLGMLRIFVSFIFFLQLCRGAFCILCLDWRYLAHRNSMGPFLSDRHARWHPVGSWSDFLF